MSKEDNERKHEWPKRDSLDWALVSFSVLEFGNNVSRSIFLQKNLEILTLYGIY